MKIKISLSDDLELEIDSYSLDLLLHSLQDLSFKRIAEFTVNDIEIYGESLPVNAIQFRYNETNESYLFSIERRDTTLIFNFDFNGITYFIFSLQRMLEKLHKSECIEHEHYMTEDWAGNELTQFKINPDSVIINMLTIYSRK